MPVFNKSLISKQAEEQGFIRKMTVGDGAVLSTYIKTF
jgi:hypothetical protein